tara:strand:- start:71 stop:235 length:165 start_codon:yes stop_codon:yes gene_type:complete
MKTLKKKSRSITLAIVYLGFGAYLDSLLLKKPAKKLVLFGKNDKFTKKTKVLAI